MKYTIHALSAAIAVCVSASAVASSHREAPSITKVPKVDATDFYMFNSYEDGRSDYVTIIANYLPLQDAYGGPNYFALDPDALYEIHIDNTGDGVEDLTFQFDFEQTLTDAQLPIGPDGTLVSIPLKKYVNGAADFQQTAETYNLTMVNGDRRSGTRTNLGTFDKPLDNIGSKSTPNYANYAADFVQDVNFGSCGTGQVFVGQRQDGFAVNLGAIFDSLNFNPLGARTGQPNDLADKNVTSIALEVPKNCLAQGSDATTNPVIGGWTTASVRQATLVNPMPASGINTSAKKGGAWTQVSRLGSPLVNEVVIGLKDKDKFNASEPKDDAANFAPYVFTPTLPAVIELQFGATAPTNFPRTDLIAAFLTGIDTVNQVPAGSNMNAVPSEMLRLNTAVPAVSADQQQDLGPLATPDADLAGFPNGRRPGDDVVDVALRATMGVLCVSGFNTQVGCVATDAPSGDLELTDGTAQPATTFMTSFPYLNTPIAGE